MNLIVTCGRNLESEAKNEIKKIINELGDQELEILDSGMRGVLTVNTVVKPSEVIDYVKNKINEAGLTPVSLSSKSILELENMEEEKYRKQI